MISDGGDSGSKKCKETMVGSGSVYFGGSLVPAGRFCVDSFSRKLASVAVKMRERMK